MRRAARASSDSTALPCRRSCGSCRRSRYRRSSAGRSEFGQPLMRIRRLRMSGSSYLRDQAASASPSPIDFVSARLQLYAPGQVTTSLISSRADRPPSPSCFSAPYTRSARPRHACQHDVLRHGDAQRIRRRLRRRARQAAHLIAGQITLLESAPSRSRSPAASAGGRWFRATIELGRHGVNIGSALAGADRGGAG